MPRLGGLGVVGEFTKLIGSADIILWVREFLSALRNFENTTWDPQQVFKARKDS